MKTLSQIKKSLSAHCRPFGCDECDYEKKIFCRDLMIKDVYECIQQLENQVPKWIGVEERLPEPGEDVVLCVRCGDVSCVRSGWRTKGVGVNGFICPGDTSLDGYEVTHWMPMPPPPPPKE